jgi:hypothetical protein
MAKYRVGSDVVLSEDALENYGEKYRDKVFKVKHVATKYMPAARFFAEGQPSGYHPGYDDAGEPGRALYDLEGLNFSVYDWEVQKPRAKQTRMKRSR